MANSDQKDFLREPDRNYIVEASAGTGKTRRILDRIAFLIEAGLLTEASGLAAITFTEKAASELRNKLRQKIEERMEKTDGDEKERLNRMLLEFDQAEISTIHSFCARLIRLRPVEAGVAPGFEVMDDSERDLIFDRVWEKWLEESLETAPEFFELLKLANLNFRALKSLARDLFENRDLFRANFQALTKVQPGLTFEKAEAEVRGIKDQITAKRLSVTDLAKPIDAILSFVQDTESDARNQARIWYQVSLGSLRTKTWSTPGSMELKAKFIAVIDQIKAEVLARILKYLAGFLRKMKEEKKKIQKLDFQDLLFFARDLVKTSEEARNYFKSRFQYLLVDEFQDTDPVQVELIFFLAEDKKSFARTWQEVSLAPGKLFLVGDPKQSIYRFRRADLEIYDLARDQLKASRFGKEEFLEYNYRSDPKILEWVNAAFQDQFPRGGEKGFQPEYQELLPGVQDPPLPELQKPLPKPVVIIELEKDESLVQPGKKSFGVPNVRMVEARAIADFIQAGVGKIQVWEKQDQKFIFRPAKYRDFAVLYSVHDHIQAVKEELRSRNLPFQIEASKEFLQRDEIAGLRAILSVLVNPLDQVALVGALRSLFLGVSDIELLQFHLSRKNWEWLGQTLDPKKFPAVSSAFEFLNTLFRMRDRKSLGWMIEQMISRSRVRKLRRLHPQFNQALLNLERIKAASHSFDQDPGGGINGFIDWLANLEEKESSDWPELLAFQANDAVNLMTFHKSKGLEFPIVIVANLSNQLPGRPGALTKNWKDNQLAVRLDNFQTLNYEEMAQAEARHIDCQNLRSLYVATTRAKQYLVIPDHRKIEPKGDRYIHKLSAGLPGSPDPAFLSKILDQRKASSFQLPRETGKSGLEQLISGQYAATRMESGKKEFEQVQKEKIARAKDFMEIRAPSQEEGSEEFRPESEPARRRAMDLGALIHRVIELAGKGNLETALQLAERLAKENDLMNRLEEIEQLLKNFWESDLQKELSALPCFQEAPFLLEDEGTLWRGKIDLIVREKDGLRLIDLKTDRVRKDQIEEHNRKYQRQMKIYQKALTDLKSVKLTESAIFYLDPKIKSKI